MYNYYSAFKEESISFTMTWVDLSDFMLNKAYQSRKTTSQVLPYTWNLRREGRMHT